MRTWDYIDNDQYEDLMEDLAKRYTLRKGLDGIIYLGYYPILLSDGYGRYAMHIDFSKHVASYKRSQTQTEESQAHAAKKRSPRRDVRVKRVNQSIKSHPTGLRRWMNLLKAAR